MSERMIPIPFEQLMNWIATEFQREGTVFGVRHGQAGQSAGLSIFDFPLESPIGPAAGPHTQLAQNIVAAYVAGARFFELKTVQQMDGADLAACISRPCILAEDEGYNCEWSTELYVSQAYEEYVKAWCACHMLAKVYGFGEPGAFVFNMSVGYDLAGIRSPKIDSFIEGMKDASRQPIWTQCMDVLRRMFPAYGEFVDTINPQVSNSITLSTLHGCPASEIEAIASYLLEEKGVHTFIKCNPTLLGYETVRNRLDGLGYGYISFTRKHFENDLQYGDAVPMFRRLWALAGKRGLEFGLKLSNTFPVDVTRQELPSEEMYLSGKALYPLTMEMAARLSGEFEGKLRLSYSGGADYFNIDKLFSKGIWPITVCTTLLKPGGYERFRQLAEKVREITPPVTLDGEGLEKLSQEAASDDRHRKPKPRRVPRKQGGAAPLMDCDKAACQEGCPLEQDIPSYLKLAEEGRWEEALEVILARNPLPFITGTICYQFCSDGCTRRYYDQAVEIRKTKLLAAERGYDAVLAKLAPAAPNGKRAAVIGGGPTGMAAAHLLAREGTAVTLFEKGDRLGGLVRTLLTKKQITHEAIDKDAAMLDRLGVDIRLNTAAPAIADLKAQGYDWILLAVGGWKKTRQENLALYEANGVPVGENGYLSMETGIPQVWAAGDCLRGVSSVAQGIGDALAFAEAVLGRPIGRDTVQGPDAQLQERRGVLADCDGKCLDCRSACRVCAEVCPNRANVVIGLPDGRREILHVDRMCNECGSCTSFCPYESAPYRAKLTLFHDRETFAETRENSGFLPLGGRKVLVRLEGKAGEYDLSKHTDLPQDLEIFITTVLRDYRYLIG